jgi:hypothetical protein
VEPDTRILLQELANQRRLMSRQVVEDDVNLLTRRAQGDYVLKEGDEVATGVRAAVLPWTRPVAVSSAAYRESVPCR